MHAEERPPAYLILEDGSVFEGWRLGAEGVAVGEVVFNTSMTGYQEMLTDPSYGGQILAPTYPLIGNYGINARDWESNRIQVRGFVVRSDCDLPSHPDSVLTVHEYLSRYGVPGVAGVDTRAITRRLRSRGVMMGVVAGSPDVGAAREIIASNPRYGDEDVVSVVTTPRPYWWDGTERHGEPREGAPVAPPGIAARGAVGALRIVVADYGVKYNIIRSLAKRGCEVVVVSADASAEEILAYNPRGVVLSPGPGDPELLDRCVDTARKLVGAVPLMGICLGHQVIARAMGARTYKLKFGHRGGNHAVRDLATGRVYITAQNHGYAVAAEDLPPGLQVSHVNLTDNTVEGLRHATLPLMTIQYHSEASPGPWDNDYLFDRFLEMVREMVRSGRTDAAGRTRGRAG